MRQHGAVEALRGRKALKGVLALSGALIGTVYGVHVSVAHAKPRTSVEPRASTRPRVATPQGTIWMQVLNAGASKEDSFSTEGIPGKSIADSLVRATPLRGLSLRGLACYGVTCDPVKNEICFMRGRSAPHESQGINVFYLASADGTNVRFLKRPDVDYTSDKVEDFGPRFMPDGDILFEEGGRLAIMSRTGANVRYLTGQGENCGNATVSRDGKRVAFESMGLNIMDADGKHRLKLLNFPTFYGGEGKDGEELPYTDVALSPDGKQVAYARDEGKMRQIYVLSTAAPASKTNPSQRVSGFDSRFKLAHYANPVWSPDGKFLVVAGGTENSHDVYVLNLATKKMRRLTRTPQDEYPNVWVSTTRG